MENLRILSMNLGRRFVPIKDKGKREYITDFIKEEGYDIVMLQGNIILIIGVDNYIPSITIKKYLYYAMMD